MSPSRRLRLDRELVRRGLARSREEATGLVRAGSVTVDGRVASKPATMVATASALVVSEPDDQPRWASRGAYKLIGALEAFESAGLRVEGRRCLDAGASTGGFTDVLLRRGARGVVAVDVGYGQLDWRLRSDPRVTVMDRRNIRYLTPDDLEPVGGAADVVVADLSFIPLERVLPALASCTREDSDLVLMVKPQFEVGPGHVGRGGVVSDPGLRADAVRRVAAAAADLGWGTAGLATSPLPGPSGNREYFLWLRRDSPGVDDVVVTSVVEESMAWSRKRGFA